jgi:hypothetical protein
MRYAVDTRLDAEAVYKEAEAFFGPEGNGLTMAEGTPGCCARFESNLGYVYVDIQERDKGSAVELETREYDIQVRDFMRHLPK